MHFRDLIPLLSDRFHVVAPDYMGFGYSSNPSAQEFRYTFDNLTEKVEKLLFDELKLNRFSVYVQDYGAPVGFRIASRDPKRIEAISVQNGNAYVEGISKGFDPLKPFWANRNAETEKPARALITPESIKFQYTHGVQDLAKISPDSYSFDQFLMARAGSDAIQLDLFQDYVSNVALYDEWHEYFRTHQPPMLIVWGKNDPFFTVDGAQAFSRDLPNAELHLLDTGHFALEDNGDVIAGYIRNFLGLVTGGQQ
jgi:pimeloyl-ACP methyl ester carboxylesterase